MYASLSFRSRILLIVLAGVITPLMLTGVWLAHGAQRSGEELLRARLDEALERTAVELQVEWARQRSRLLDVADSAGFGDARPRDEGTARSPALDGLLERSGSAARAAVLRGADDEELVRLEVGPARSGESYLRVELPLFGRGLPHPDGVLEADLPASALLSANATAAAAGVVIGLYDARTGVRLSPFPVEPGLVTGGRFTWAGDEWLLRRRPVDEPPVVVVAAAPVEEFTAPFASAARRGLLVVAVISLSALALATLLTNRVTALRERSEQRALAAVGEFAATLAHEVRNPLTAVRVDLQYVEERLPPDSALREVQASALQEIERLDATVGSALQVARSAQVQRRRMDLREPIAAAARAAQPAFADAGARLDPPDMARPLRVLGDATTLERLFLNLLLNAAQALPAGGRARVDTDLTADDVVVRVVDDGSGIDADRLPLVFEPFYTTRGDGTGLGLAVARRVASSHGGDVHIESAPGAGTTVTVRLPRADV